MRPIVGRYEKGEELFVDGRLAVAMQQFTLRESRRRQVIGPVPNRV
jgi:hypothetical protein